MVSTFPLMTLGAVGVISVIGNAFPREFSRMVRLALAGDYDSARTIHHQLHGAVQPVVRGWKSCRSEEYVKYDGLYRE